MATKRHNKSATDSVVKKTTFDHNNNGLSRIFIKMFITFVTKLWNMISSLVSNNKMKVMQIICRRFRQFIFVIC